MVLEVNLCVQNSGVFYCLICYKQLSSNTRRCVVASEFVIFIYSPCDSSGALCLVMLHRASLVPSSDRCWIRPTAITACQIRTSSI